MAVAGQSVVRVRAVTDPSGKRAGSVPRSGTAIFIAACWRLTFQFFGATTIAHWLVRRTRNLNFSAGSRRPARYLLPWRLIAGDLEVPLSASRLHADSRDGGLRSDRTGSPSQKDRLSLGIAPHTALARNRGALMFSAT